MGKANSRRGASAAPAQEPSPPSRKRRRGKHARAAHAKPLRSACPGVQSVQAESATPVRPRESGDPEPKNWIPASAGMSGECLNFSGSNASLSRSAPAPGPSLRQDIPRPPLRTLLLRMRRHGRLAWHRGRARFHAAQRDLRLRMRRRAARTVATILARLDAYIWQPATWPFRRAQRELLARTLATLSVAFVALAWIAAYSAMAPTQDARPPAPPPASPKPFTERVVSRALPSVNVPIVEVPLPVPAPNKTPPATGL